MSTSEPRSGRFRSAMRFIFSVGGTEGISPIAKESHRDRLLREQNEHLARIAAAQPAAPEQESQTPEWRAAHVPASAEYKAAHDKHGQRLAANVEGFEAQLARMRPGDPYRRTVEGMLATARDMQARYIRRAASKGGEQT